METKQVIVIRRDLGMRRGKEIAQGAHASMAWLTKRLTPAGEFGLVHFSEAEREWLASGHRKVTCQVDTLDDLIAVEAAAEDAGLEVNVVMDSGLTEFAGNITTTCLAIGPDYEDRIDKVTGGLRLY